MSSATEPAPLDVKAWIILSVSCVIDWRIDDPAAHLVLEKQTSVQRHSEPHSQHADKHPQLQTNPLWCMIPAVSTRAIFVSPEAGRLL